MGVLTACAGGIIRDVLAGEPSILMRPELYVTAAALAAGSVRRPDPARHRASGSPRQSRSSAGFALARPRDRARLVIAGLSRLGSPHAQASPSFLRSALAACATVPRARSARARASRRRLRPQRRDRQLRRGIADPQSGRRVTADDPVRVASVSKMVVAIGVMKLVEAGKLDLDPDVSRWLGWTLAQPELPRPADHASHAALAHQLGARARRRLCDPARRIAQAVMPDPTNWDAQHGPGDDYFTYTNLNFPIVGSIDRARHRRAVRHLDAPRMCSSR